MLNKAVSSAPSLSTLIVQYKTGEKSKQTVIKPVNPERYCNRKKYLLKKAAWFLLDI